MHIVTALPAGAHVRPGPLPESVLSATSLAWRDRPSAWPTVARFADWSNPTSAGASVILAHAGALADAPTDESGTGRMARLAVAGVLDCHDQREARASVPVRPAASWLERLACRGRVPSIPELLGLAQTLVPLEPVQRQQALRAIEVFVRTQDGTWMTCCPAREVRDRLRRLLAGMQAALDAGHPVLPVAAWAYRGVCLIHPLPDGNGRLARALASLVLLQRGRPPLWLRSEDRPRLFGSLAQDAVHAQPKVTAVFADAEARTVELLVGSTPARVGGDRPTG